MRKLLLAVLCILAVLGMSGCQNHADKTSDAPKPEKEDPAPSLSKEEDSPSQAQQFLQSSPDLLPQLPSQSAQTRPEDVLEKLPDDLRPQHPKDLSPELPSFSEQSPSVSIESSTSADHLKRLVEQRVSPKERGCVSSSKNRLIVYCADRAAAQKVRAVFCEHPEYHDAKVYVSYSPYTMEKLLLIKEELEELLRDKVGEEPLRYGQNSVDILEAQNKVAILVEEKHELSLRSALAVYDERGGAELLGREYFSLPDAFSDAAALRDHLTKEIPEASRGTLYAAEHANELIVSVPDDEEESFVKQTLRALAQDGGTPCTVFYRRSPLSLAGMRKTRQELSRAPQLLQSGALESVTLDPALCEVQVFFAREAPKALEFLDTYEPREAVTVFERIS